MKARSSTIIRNVRSVNYSYLLTKLLKFVNNPVYVGFLYTLVTSLFDELSFKISKSGS